MPQNTKVPRSETVAFVAGEMKKNPEVSMTELKKLGKAKGYNVYALIIGLARKELGIARGAGRPAGKRGPGRPPGKRGPGRPPGSARRGPGRPPKSAGFTDLQGIVDHLRGLERESGSLRQALSRIADIAAGA